MKAILSVLQSTASRLGIVVRIVVVLQPQGPWFDHELANYVYQPMLTNNIGS